MIRGLVRALKAALYGWRVEIKPHRPSHEIVPNRAGAYDNPLIEAIRDHDHERTLALVEDPKLVDRPDERGVTPLMHAVIAKNYNAIDLLLVHGADPNAVDEDGWGAKAWAWFLDDKEAMKRIRGLTVLKKETESDLKRRTKCR